MQDPITDARAPLAASRSASPAVPAELAQLLERGPDHVLQHDDDGAISYLNATARSALGLGADAPLVSLNLRDWLDDASRHRFDEVIVPALRRDGHWSGVSELRLGHRGAAYRHVAVSHGRGPTGRGRHSALLSAQQDGTASDAALARQADVMRAIAEAIPATVVVVDVEGRYRFVNAAFEQLVGRRADQILGRTAVEIIGAAEVARRGPYMRQAWAGEAVDFVLDYPGADGTEFRQLSCIPLKLNGAVDGFVGISRDVTIAERERARLLHLAERDPLTGLYNRAGFDAAVERALAAAGPEGWVALLYIDLDHFKPVNDARGHPTGDALLQRFARRLLRSVRVSDVVARLGGDEFAILLCGISEPGAARGVADKVLDVARQPFEIDGAPVGVGASVGVAISRGGPGDWRRLVVEADRLLYRAKAEGRGRAVLAQVDAPG